MIRIGKYTTQDGREARIYFPIRDTLFSTIGWVRGIGLVAFDQMGKVAYDHIPQEYSLNLESWQQVEQEAQS